MKNNPSTPGRNILVSISVNGSSARNLTGRQPRAGPDEVRSTAMSMALGSRKDVSSEMNVTPLLDVLLVLFIIFMVMPHHRGEVAEIPMPHKTAQVRSPDVIVIQLHSNGEAAPKLSINHETVAWEALDKRLREIYINRTDMAAFVKGDPEIDFQYVADVLDIARHAGVARVGLMGSGDTSYGSNFVD
jgi:biopolymer transport protein ExbD